MPIEEYTHEKQPPAEKPTQYEFNAELLSLIRAAQDWCRQHKPDVHLLAIVGHMEGRHLDVQSFVAGDSLTIIELHERQGEVIAKQILRDVLQQMTDEPAK